MANDSAVMQNMINGQIWTKCGSDTNSLLMVCVHAGQCRSHNGAVWSLQTSGSRVFSCGADCCIKAWDLDNLVRGCKTNIVAHQQRVSQRSSVAALQLVQRDVKCDFISSVYRF